jgi:hypothetical protein
MPHEAQALYFHLCLNADDDGVVEAYTIIKTTGANEDVFRVLVAKGFVVPLNDDDVAYILDWQEHNKLRSDRKIDSIYKELLVKIMPEVRLLQARNRVDRPPKEDMGRPRDNHGTAQYSIGKESVVEDSRVKVTTTNVVEAEPMEKKVEKEIYGKPEINAVLDTFQKVFKHDSMGTKQKDRICAKHLTGKFSNDQILAMMVFCRDNQYAPQVGSVTDLWNARSKIVAGIRKFSTEKKQEKTIREI